ncbi:DUF5318 family protein [Frankia sp. AgB1.9]|uniref:DUF5318 family protein n=1 Tax=unclassified Frankia TaxID=2632575 RepID=UPI0019331C16|nr:MULTISPECIES: DUF5318 family protein [unclassified Frankia]MBL7494038.1 DUF5318 family protein [Frankia sp. AgW1.1]MBL7547518.1 DUF5318 family protein [Frankia sp. AgB1.9]MBL7619028.1 DUF5318 family protein [Frankia sp. AgB1.8]
MGPGPGARSIIDYALARRAVLTDLSAGRVSRPELCDANPYLLRAARHHGEPTTRSCPVCHAGDPERPKPGDPLVNVTYGYGDELGDTSGRAWASADLPALAGRFSELRIYVVEVCAECGWNHLVMSYVIGTGGTPVRRISRRAE